MRFHTPGRAHRLLGVDLLREGDVEPPEVGELARRVDLGLVAGLGLAQHRRGVQPVAPRAREQVGGAQQHGGALVEGQVRARPVPRAAPPRPRPWRPRGWRCRRCRGRGRGRAGRRRRTGRRPRGAGAPSMVTGSSWWTPPSSASAACRLARPGCRARSRGRARCAAAGSTVTASMPVSVGTRPARRFVLRYCEPGASCPMRQVGQLGSGPRTACSARWCTSRARGSPSRSPATATARRTR